MGLQAANDDAIREAIDLLLDQIDAIVNQKYLRQNYLEQHTYQNGALKALNHEKITILDTFDRTQQAQEPSQQLCNLYPKSKSVFERWWRFSISGRGDEVTMHLLVHLRRWTPEFK